jgi:hypothetical protein
MIQYFMLANFDGESSFDDGMSEDERLERLPLQIVVDLEKILRRLTVIEHGRIISEQNINNN